MSDPISVTLDNLLKDHQTSVRTFDGISHTEIVTNSKFKYVLNGATNIKINMNLGCKQLTLNNCKNITICSDRLPIMGIYIVRTDNIKVDIVGTPPKSGSGFMSLNHSIQSDLGTDQDCMVEISECTGIVFNGTNISDTYHDSIWRIV